MGHCNPVAAREDLKANDGSYANLVLGSLMMLPDDAFRLLLKRCYLGPTIPTERLIISSECTLCGGKMSEDHMHNCKRTNLYRILRHDILVSWLMTTRQRCTVSMR